MNFIFGYWGLLLSFLLLQPQIANAASFEGTLQALVNGFVGKILPILAFGFVGKNIFDHIQGDPMSGKNSIRIGVAVVCLLGLNAIWGWLQDKVR